MASRENQLIEERRHRQMLETHAVETAKKIDLIMDHLGLRLEEDEPPVEEAPAGGGEGEEGGDDIVVNPDFESRPVSELEIPEGLASILEDEGIETVADLRARLADEDNKIPGVGEARRKQLLEAIGAADEQAPE